MKILLLEKEPLNLPLALKAVENGHEVYWYQGDPKKINTETGDGFSNKIHKIDNWVSWIHKVDLVVYTDNDKWCPRLDAFRKRGLKIYSPSQASANLEIKRKVGLEFLKKHGIDVPRYKEFKHLNDARKFLETDKGRYVIKALGSEEDKSLTYLSKSAADMLEHFDWLERNKIQPKGSFILQEYIKGTEFGAAAWMSTKGFIGLPTESVEHKALCAGNIGPSTGEQGTLQKYTTESKIFNEVLKPLEKGLVELGHLSLVDVNCIIDEQGKVWPLEFTTRFPYPGIHILLQHNKGDCIQWMYDACEGKDTLKVDTEHGIAVVINIPSYPFGDPLDEKSQDRPIYGLTDSNKKHIHPQDVKIRSVITQTDKGEIIKKKGWVTTGDYVLVVTAAGDSVKQTQERVSKTIKEIFIPGIFYRIDIGDRFRDEQIQVLHNNAYAESWK